MRLTHPHRTGALLLGFMLSVGLTNAAYADSEGETARTSAAKPSHGGAIWGREYFPNVILTTHEGKKVRFFDDLIEGKVVVINFIYTSCPDACPLETARLAEVQGILGDRVGKDVFMYSITIDPDRDTPEVLAEYRERFQAEEGWTFLTGAEQDITLLRRKLGLYIDDIDQDAGDHNLNLMLGNQSSGRWQKSSPFENPYILASLIGQSLSSHSTARTTKNSYEDAPKLRNIGDGETLYRTRCKVCHAIGSSDEDALKPRVGPNLLGVTDRREHDWLVRWIREPDVMVKEQDSIAVGLFYAYNQVPMPNLRLSSQEIGQVLDYIGTESKRVTKHELLLTVLPKKNDDAEVESCCQKSEKVVLSATVADELLASECEKTGSSECGCDARRPAPSPRLFGAASAPSSEDWRCC